MILRWEPQPTLRRMAQILIPGMRETGNDCVFASVGDRAILCFNEFRWANMAISVASTTPRWATPAVMREIAQYVFVDSDCRRLSAQTETTNEACVRLLKGLGFQREGIMRRASYNQSDMVLFSMLREECRFLKDTEDEYRRLKST